jgi:hypothetical protein
MRAQARRAKRYIAYCTRCHSCCLKQTDSKREAARAAVSHMNAYHHETGILDAVEEAARKAEREVHVGIA